MKIFTTQNLVFLIVAFLIFLFISGLMIFYHRRYINRIKEMKADAFYKKNSKHYEVNVVDNRKRIYVSKSPMNMNIDPYRDALQGADQYDPNLSLRTYVPKEKTFGFKRFARVMFIILFAISFLTIIFSSILMLSEFFHQDIYEILHVEENSRTFFDYFIEYDVVFGSFFINVICLLGVLFISDSIKTFHAYSPLYLRKFNQQEFNITYSPVIIEVN